MTYSFQYKVNINGKPRILLVRYQVRDGKPELLRHCTCLDTSEIFLVNNWYSRFYTEALERVKGVAA